jgi:hypothetical protein
MISPHSAGAVPRSEFPHSYSAVSSNPGIRDEALAARSPPQVEFLSGNRDKEADEGARISLWGRGPQEALGVSDERAWSHGCFTGIIHAAQPARAPCLDNNSQK